MKNSGYFWPLVIRPTLIDKSGSYLTRSGDVVSIEAASTQQDFGCRGAYENGVSESWHKSGRIFATRETANDIVGHASETHNAQMADEIAGTPESEIHVASTHPIERERG